MQRQRRRPAAILLAGIASAAALLATAGPASANHPVLVEGSCLGAGAAQRTLVVPGTCGDYDGDGRIGTAEDTDEADRVFGTINAALGNTDLGATLNPTRANQNGRVTIVASGVFPEIVTITAAGGNVTLEAAPGVDANIDAVAQGVPGGADRQASPGVIVNSPAERRVTIRNVMSRNWTEGFRILGYSRATLDGVRAENNRDYGIRVQDYARVAISHAQVNATGFRAAPGVDNTPNPGIGIEFEGQSRGSIFFTSVTGSFAGGLVRESTAKLTRDHVQLFDNNPDFVVEG
ncbi:MAG: hypothetical protein ACRDKS_11575 [Actinomycetota bacterium]